MKGAGIMSFEVIKQYRYTDSDCDCGQPHFTFSKRKAKRNAQGNVEEVWAIRRAEHSGEVLADAYSEQAAHRIADALNAAEQVPA